MLLTPAEAWSTIPRPSVSHAPTTSLQMVATGKQRFWNRGGVKSVVRNTVQPRSRPSVTYDPTAGTVTSQKVTPSKWKSFKSGIYKSVDTVGSLASKLRPTFRSDPPREGYNDVIERRVFDDDTTGSPGERLMKEYKQRAPSIEVAQPEVSSFDTFKESVYSATEGMFQEQNVKQQPTIVTFKPATQPNIAASAQVREALPQLNSRNPVKRWLAERKIRQWEEEQRRREAALEFELQIQSIKDTVYTVVDTVQAGVNVIAQTPSNIAEAASATQDVAMSFVDWASTVPGAIQSTAETIASIPAQVSQTVTGVQETMDTTVKSTQQFVEDVAAIPQKVQQSVEGTTRTVENTVKSVDDAVTTVKIWTGLEEPPPPPPKPPKELTVSNIAWSVTEGVTDLAWWLGKGALQLGWMGTRAAFKSATKPKQKKIVRTKAADTRPPAPPQMAPPQQVELAGDNQNFDQEVTEALQLAQRALMVTETETTGNEQLEEAVRRAKKAAIAATQDAVDVENMINQTVSDED